jgi:CheY-like chemotaxis protein
MPTLTDPEDLLPEEIAGTVLCIEDQPVSMELVEAMLSLYSNVRLLKAFNGRDGIRLTQEAQPDVVLLDMHLPDMGGLDVVRALNEQISRGGLRVVLLTADSFSIEVIKAMSLGAHAYWPKPLTLARMQTGLQRLLDPNRRTPHSTAPSR